MMWYLLASLFILSVIGPEECSIFAIVSDMKQDETLYDEIAHEFISKQPYRTIPYPPTLLIFSAMPGSGKTTLARKLAADLQAQYINHDAIRDFIRRKGVDPELVYMPAVSIRIEEQIMANDANKLIILDGSLDRTWEIFFKTASNLKAMTIIIRLTLPLTIIRDRLRIRDKEDSKLLDQMERFKNDFEECQKHVAADLTLGKDYNYAEVLEFVRNKLHAAKSAYPRFSGN